MRIALAVLAWVGCVGGVAAWLAARDGVRPPAPAERAAATGVYTVEATASFDAEPDPFALDAGGAKAAALRVTVNGAEVLRVTERVSAGKPVAGAPAPDVRVGRNDVFVQANPPAASLSRAHAVRLRVLRDGEPVAERTFWTDPGTPLSERFALEVPAAREPGDGH